ncbi:hypothetical protein AB0J86_27165 [Micromonospora sp. NPDC049559]|uniref:hypothetical protein n=1 Tax=Micromonospora sp. NPDC049559 TaxID=3155923 RepID=UPI003413A6CB
MDVFSRTFLPAAVAAGVTPSTVSRHIPVFRRCVESRDTTVLVARCTRLDRPMQGEYLLLLTHQRLVVTQQTRLLHRLRLHLNTELRHLSNVTWNADPQLGTVELAATAVDGIRERFLIKVGEPKQVWHLDALLANAFRDRTATTPAALWGTRAATPVGTSEARNRSFNPAVAI